MRSVDGSLVRGEARRALGIGTSGGGGSCAFPNSPRSDFRQGNWRGSVQHN